MKTKNQACEELAAPKKPRQQPAGKSAQSNSEPASDVLTPKDPEFGKALTSLALSGAFNAAAVIEPLQKNLAGNSHVSFDLLLDDLRRRTEALQKGNTSDVESMLLSQATALQTLFSSLARRAVGQEYLKQYQTFLTLALKAQAQSRATLEALIELKHPRYPATFVKQANIAHGPQQVNNGSAPDAEVFSDTSTRTRAPAHAEQSLDAPNRLLEAEHERLDARAQATASRSHSGVETVGTVNRPQVECGKGEGSQKRVEGRQSGADASVNPMGERRNS